MATKTARLRAYLGRNPRCDLDAVCGGTRLDRKFVISRLAQLRVRGEVLAADGVYWLDPEFQSRRADRGGAKVRGFRAEARARKRAAKPHSVADIVPKHFGAPEITFESAFEVGAAPPSASVAAVLRSSFDVVVSLMSVGQDVRQPALRHACESHARMLALLR